MGWTTHLASISEFKNIGTCRNVKSVFPQQSPRRRFEPSLTRLLLGGGVAGPPSTPVLYLCYPGFSGFELNGTWRGNLSPSLAMACSEEVIYSRQQTLTKCLQCVGLCARPAGGVETQGATCPRAVNSGGLFID